MFTKYPVKISNEILRKREPLANQDVLILSATEYRLILTLSSLIKTNFTKFITHEISVREFCRFWCVSYGGTQTETISESILKLRSKSFLIGDKRIKWLDDSCKIVNGVMFLRFDDSMSEYLLNLESNYTKIDLNNIVDLKSKYTLNLYLYLKSLEAQKFYNIRLKSAYKILGDNRYKTRSEFERNILQKSVSEINEKTDITVSRKFIKDLGYPDIIRFYIVSKEEQARKNITTKKKSNIDIYVDDEESFYKPSYNKLKIADESDLPF